MKVLVTDGAGYLGRRLVRALQDAGHSVNCLVGDSSDAASVQRGTPTSSARAGLTQLLDGVSVAFLLCTVARPDEQFGGLATALRQAILRRIIIVSPEENAAPAHDWLELLRGCGVELVHVQYGPLFGVGSPLLEAVRYTAERLPIVPCTAWMRRTICPIDVTDVVRQLRDLISRAGPDMTILMTGAEATTFEQLVKSYSSFRALRRPTLNVAGNWPKVSAQLLMRLTPVPKCDIVKLVEYASTQPPSSLAAPTLRLGSGIWHAALGEERVSAVRSNLRADLNRACHTVVRRHGFVIGIWETLVAAPQDVVFATVERIGGEHGWYFADELWRLRGWLDRVVGGVGMERRRDPCHLELGDTFDFWIVEHIEPRVRVRLRARMRMPGRAWLGLECAARNDDTTLLRTVVTYQPTGLLGELYWTVLYPFHVLIFDGMHEAIARESRRQALSRM